MPDYAYDATAELVKINPVPSVIMDLQTMNIAVVNEAACRLLGYTERELLTMAITALLPREDIERALQATAEPVPEGETTWRCIGKSGKLIYVKIKYRDTMFRGRAARFIVVIESSSKPFKL
jgi:PAS domain S-box-containing protein